MNPISGPPPNTTFLLSYEHDISIELPQLQRTSLEISSQKDDHRRFVFAHARSLSKRNRNSVRENDEHLLAAFDDQVVSRFGTTTSQYLNGDPFQRIHRRRRRYRKHKYNRFGAELIGFNKSNVLNGQFYPARTAQGNQTVFIGRDQLPAGQSDFGFSVFR